MVIIFNRKTLTLLFCILLFNESLSLGHSASPMNVDLGNTRDDLLVYLKIDNSISEMTKKLLASGLPVTVSFHILLYQEHHLWIDKRIAELSVSQTIKYNNSKQKYVIKRLWVDKSVIITGSFHEAQKIIMRVDSLRIVSLGKLDKGKSYQIKARAEIKKIPPAFTLIFPIATLLWDFDTDWFTVNFTY